MLATIIIGALVAILFVAASIYIYKKGTCGGSCGDCSSCGKGNACSSCSGCGEEKHSRT
ncbi:MAG: FeoB-associated Cys-rich membrane protein [Anaerovoracaceae bacterium]